MRQGERNGENYIEGAIGREGRKIRSTRRRFDCARRRRRDASGRGRRCAGADHAAGRSGRRRPEFAAHRPARADRARGLSFPRENLPLRPRAHSRARRACARLRRARLFRELRIARRHHPRRSVPARRGKDAGLRPLLDRGGQQGLGRSGARRARLRGQALYQGRQLGHRRQQHPGLLHSGRDQVSRYHPCRQGRAGPRLSAGADRARQFLGLHLADPGKHAHGAVDHVRPHDPALVPLHGRVRRPHLPAGQCRGQIDLRQVPLEAEARDAVRRVE